MAAKVKLGDRVFAKATKFDSREGARLFEEVFGENWDKEVCRGFVDGLKKRCLRWDIDQSVSKYPTSLLSRNRKSSRAGDTRRGVLEEGYEEKEDYSSSGEESLSSEDEEESGALPTSSSVGMMRARVPGVTRLRRMD